MHTANYPAALAPRPPHPNDPADPNPDPGDPNPDPGDPNPDPGDPNPDPGDPNPGHPTNPRH
jgi:hypothetical protein